MKNKFIVLSDIHFPYQDDKALKAVYKFLEQHPVDTIILNGDILDFYDVSRFDKDPQRMFSLQTELDMAENFFKKLRKLFPEAEMYFVKGNHEDRMERYLQKHSELFTLKALKIPTLLQLEKFNIHYKPKGFKFGSLKIIHGDLIRKFSSYTARGELEKHDSSGISGHTHRGGVYYYKTPERYLAWFESFCLCDVHPFYVDDPNWQSGFLYGYTEGDSFAVTPIPIVDGKIKCVLLEE